MQLADFPDVSQRVSKATIFFRLETRGFVDHNTMRQAFIVLPLGLIQHHVECRDTVFSGRISLGNADRSIHPTSFPSRMTSQEGRVKMNRLPFVVAGS